MMFIVMMYSAAIPILYPAGLGLMIVSYWQDKVMFLRHYRLPPRYGRALAARVVEILELGVILHLFFGLYMLSNPDIFTYENEKLSAPRWMQGYASLFSKGATRLLGDQYEERFSQVHTVIYCFGIGIFLFLFVLDKVTGLLTKLFAKLYNALDDQHKEREFSMDIYSELSPDQQHAEHQSTSTAVKHIDYRITRGDSKNPLLYEYFHERLKLKKAEMGNKAKIDAIRMKQKKE